MILLVTKIIYTCYVKHTEQLLCKEFKRREKEQTKSKVERLELSKHLILKYFPCFYTIMCILIIYNQEDYYKIIKYFNIKGNVLNLWVDF